MTILPIKLISEVDQPLFGANLFNLAKLQRLDFPILAGFAISPPQIFLETVLRHCQTKEKEEFEQKLVLIKNDLLKITPPSELELEINNLFGKKQQSFLIGESLVEKRNLVWLKLLHFWLEQIRSNIWRQGFSQSLSQLSAQAIFATYKKSKICSAYFDPELKEVIVKSEAELLPKTLKIVDELVLAANKKLFLPQVYQFIELGEKIFFISVYPFTQTLITSQEENLVVPPIKQKQIIKSAVKVFLNLSSGFAVSENLDGVLIEGEKIKDFESTVFKISEAALAFPDALVIYKLPNLLDGEIKGTLRLINQKSLLEPALKAFLFAKDKKSLLNIELGIPLVRSKDELLKIKKELNDLKFWLELSIPENIINLNSYLEVGIKGIILDLDSLQVWLGGYQIEEGEFYQKQIQTLITFLGSAFKILHQNKVPILAKGNLINHPEMLDFLIEAGVFGVVANNILEADHLPEHLHFSERRIILKKFA